MFDIVIIESHIPGYTSPGFTWHCPLCIFKIEDNLASSWVSSHALHHMIADHRAVPDKLAVRIIKDEPNRDSEQSKQES